MIIVVKGFLVDREYEEFIEKHYANDDSKFTTVVQDNDSN